MGLFTKKQVEFEGPSSPAAKRAALLPTSDLVPWAETCLYQIGRSLSEFTQTGDPFALGEATQGAAALQTIISEINSRTGEQVDVGPYG